MLNYFKFLPAVALAAALLPAAANARSDGFAVPVSNAADVVVAASSASIFSAGRADERNVASGAYLASSNGEFADDNSIANKFRG
jgi:hypothetical protein